MNQLPILSIIIPVYNAKNYIEDAIKSVEAQGFSEDQIEIVCVDDGSKDGSGELLDEIAAKKHYVKVIHKKNGGAASARNEALKHINSRYYMFMDADDELIPCRIKNLIIFMDQENADICQYQYTRNREWSDMVKTPVTYHEGNMTILGFIWLYIFKTSKFVTLRFDEQLKYAEDILYNHQVIIQRPKCIVTDNICYYYRDTPDSLMAQRKPNEMADVMLRLAEDLKEIENNESYHLGRKELKDTQAFYGRAAGYYMAYSLCAGNNEYPFHMLEEKGLWPTVKEWKLLKPKRKFSKMLKDYCVFFISFRPVWVIMQKTKILYRFRHLLFH